MKNLKLLIIASSFSYLLSSNHVLGQTEGVTGAVQSVRTYGDGRVLVTGFYFNTAIACNNGSFFIPGNHPYLPRLLGTVLLAKATGATITVVAKTDNCWFPEITPDASTFVLLNPQ